MARRTVRTIGHEDRLSLVDHLEELRTRLIVCVVAFIVAFGLCFWQNHVLLNVINDPYSQQTAHKVEKGVGTGGHIWRADQAVLGVAKATESALKTLEKPGSGLSGSAREELKAQERQLEAEVSKLPTSPPKEELTTIGLQEPFTATLTVALLFAAILSLPVILFEIYGFILPAFSPRELRVANSLIASIPALFAVGVAFGYFVVLPAAVHFFQNFNSSEFNTLVQAGQYYKVAGTIMLAMGLVFQVPVAIIAATRLEIVTPAQLRRYRRYAMLACAAVAAFLPGDVVTLLLETVPLYLLYELSILLASLAVHRSAVRARREAERPPAPPPADPGGGGSGGGPGGGPEGNPPDGTGGGPSGGAEIEPDATDASEDKDGEVDADVKRVIDHFDRSLSP